MDKPKESINKPKDIDAEPKPKKPRKKYYVPTGNPPGRPKKDMEKKAQSIEKMEKYRKGRMKELTAERKAQLGAEIIAREEVQTELEGMYPEIRSARAKYKIDKEKITTHNQYITAIATLPPIDYDDPEQVRERTQLYVEIAAAAGQRIVFETLALALGMTRTMLHWRTNGKIRMTEEQRRIWQWVRTIADSALSEYAHSGESNAIASIFFARNNHGYTNADPLDVASDVDTGAEATNDEIAKKYSDLPE